ncbi:MAG TPA: hypothetical protein ENK18_20445 [Deltaproteobacteria bacterium]|nr:hypothetical protein [Deltaproteobacteria bacterium]
MDPALSNLPPIVFALAPELSTIPLGPEPLATCHDCAMQPRPGADQGRPVFTAAARCCTFQPHLSNHIVGRILLRGGPGAERLRLRLQQPEGIDPLGVRGSAGWIARYQASLEHGFGCDASLTCPYWVEGELSCSIHPDREAICRTWHCRLERGVMAQRVWSALREVLQCIEHTLAHAAMRAGDPPPPLTPPSEAPPDEVPPPSEAPPSAEVWIAWFEACAQHVDGLTSGELEALRGRRLQAALSALRLRVDERDAPMPNVLMPAVRNWSVQPHGVVLIGWSSYDPVVAPPHVFQLLSRLDGHTPWRRALASAEAALEHPIGDDLVLQLYRRGLLTRPEHTEVGEGLTVIPRLSRGP